MWKLIVRFVQAIFSIYAFVIFLLLMILIFPVVVAASFWGKITGGNLIYRLCRFWADTCLLLWGMRHKAIYETGQVTGPGIYVFNHASYMDIPEMMVAIRKNFRALGKAELTKVPLFGFIYKNAVVTVDRSSSQNRARSVAILTSVLKRNISVALAPEGTFNMSNKPLKSFYDGAFKIAIETQTPIRPLLFLDALNRLHYRSIFSFTPGILRTVFLEEIPTTGYTINDLNLLKQKVFDAMEAALIRYKASWISQ